MKSENQLAELESQYLEAIQNGDEELAKEISEEGLQLEKAIVIADQLETEIRNMHLGLSYIQIAKTAEFTAMKIHEQIPMYTGNLNPKWKLYDNVVALLKGRVNGG